MSTPAPFRRVHLARRLLAASALVAVALPLGSALAGATPPHRSGIVAASPARVVARATSSVRRARTVVVVGSVRQGHRRLGFHVATTAHGALAKGDLVSHSPKLGFVGRLEFVERGGAVYLRAGRSFWRTQVARGTSAVPAAERGRVVRLLAGRWVETTGAAARRMRSSLGPLTSPSGFVHGLLARNSLGKLRKGHLTRFRHHRALPIATSRGGVLYVAAGGAPRLLGVVARARAGRGTIVLAYPRALAVRRPAKAATLAAVLASARRS